MNGNIIQRFGLNLRGRDLVVGDIHGHFSKLQLALDAAGFAPENGDRLFSVGDLVDKGPESHLASAWLDLTWFKAACGNHDFDSTEYPELAEMPVAIEVETADGIVGILHADSPYTVWPELIADLRAGVPYLARRCMTSRHRIKCHSTRGVDGVLAVVVGHTPVQRPVVLGNVHHIDTRGWQPDGYFTLLDLDTLEPVAPAHEGE
jgi:serine/threonine protein phosphatase 1